MKLLIVVGGGGHFAPSLSVIENTPKEWEILMVGRKYSLEGDSVLSYEYQTAKKLGINFKSITAGRVQRILTKHTLKSFAKIPLGFIDAYKVLVDFRPDIVLSFGGYVSVPVVLCAYILRIPIVIHEQVLHAGAANKFAARFARRICISWDESFKYFPKDKTILTGNAIRKFNPHSKIANLIFKNNSKPLIYITGGSAGSHSINELIEGSLEHLLKLYNIVHQTGDAKEYNDFDRLSTLKESLSTEIKDSYKIFKFVEPHDALGYINGSDMVVSRSGMNTVSELLYFGKPAILIPLPYGQKNEQLENAKYIERVGTVKILIQDETTSESLFMDIKHMIENLEQYKRNSTKAKSLIKTDASDKIINVVKEVYAQKKS